MLRRYFASYRPNSPGAWKQRQRSDPYVRQCVIDDLRSRSAYKLLEVQERFRFMRPGHTILDCGAAPGGWSQIASRSVGHSGHVIAIDIRSLQPLEGVKIFAPMNFLSPRTMDTLTLHLNRRSIDVMLSDMAPDMTGQRHADHVGSIRLCDAMLEACGKLNLVKSGCLLMKVLQGGEEAALKERALKLFKLVKWIKPSSSRKESREIYMLCQGYFGLGKGLTEEES